MLDVDRLSQKDRKVWESICANLSLVPSVKGNCWRWDGARVNRNGYGRVYYEGKERVVHRIVYRLHGLHLPRWAVLDHLCEQKLCVNPNHLEPVSPGENTRRYLRRKKACKENL